MPAGLSKNMGITPDDHDSQKRNILITAGIIPCENVRNIF